MNIHFGLAPLVSLLAGMLIFVMLRPLNTIVAVYLIVIELSSPSGLPGAGPGLDTVRPRGQINGAFFFCVFPTPKKNPLHG